MRGLSQHRAVSNLADDEDDEFVPLPPGQDPDPVLGVGLPPMFEVAAHARRARIPAAVFAIAVLVAASILGHWLIGVGACLGVALGGANARFLQSSMVRFTAGAAGPAGATRPQRKQFVAGGFTRLAAITVVVVVVLLVVRELGWGMLLGLAGFQLILLGFSAFAMYRQLHGQVFGA
ncbi:MAG TPA: hypothetical protein VF288_12600 [Mycobacteriales bacterium]